MKRKRRSERLLAQTPYVGHEGVKIMYILIHHWVLCKKYHAQHILWSVWRNWRLVCKDADKWIGKMLLVLRTETIIHTKDAFYPSYGVQIVIPSRKNGGMLHVAVKSKIPHADVTALAVKVWKDEHGSIHFPVYSHLIMCRDPLEYPNHSRFRIWNMVFKRTPLQVKFDLDAFHQDTLEHFHLQEIPFTFKLQEK